jgi:polyhydroxybutyrate depolymerase
MRRALIIIFMISLPFFCFAQETIEYTITHDGLQREYVLYVPESYTGQDSVPLLFNFHGYGSNAYDQMEYGDFRPIADSVGFLISHPQGTDDDLGIPFWNVGWGDETVDDVGFTAAMIDSIDAEYNIDLERVYATGMSNGGFMSFHLACLLSEEIAAIASVTGSMSPYTYDNANPLHPMPILQIHGTADWVVPYNGGYDFTLPIMDVLQYWVDYDNCDPTPTITPLPDIDPGDGSTVEHWVYDDGDNEINVEHFKVLGGGHDWPGSSGNMDIDASEEVWNFVSRYDINGLIGGSTGIEQTSLDVPENFELSQNYPNPFNPTTTISFDLPEATTLNLAIYDVTGKLVRTFAADELWNGGSYSVIWNGEDDNGTAVSSGTYFCKMVTDKYSDVMPLVLVK